MVEKDGQAGVIKSVECVGFLQQTAMVCHVTTALSMLLSVFSAVGKKLTTHFLESKPFLMPNVGKQQIFEWLWNIQYVAAYTWALLSLRVQEVTPAC